MGEGAGCGVVLVLAVVMASCVAGLAWVLSAAAEHEAGFTEHCVTWCGEHEKDGYVEFLGRSQMTCRCVGPDGALYRPQEAK